MACDGNEGHETEDGSGEEGNGIGRREHGRNRVDQHEHEPDFDRGNIGEFVDRFSRPPRSSGLPCRCRRRSSARPSPGRRRRNRRCRHVRTETMRSYSAGLLRDRRNRLERSEPLRRWRRWRCGKTMRMPKTAISDPDGQEALLPDRDPYRCSTVALTTALSKLSETSRIERIKDDPQNAEGGGDRSRCSPSRTMQPAQSRPR